MKTINPITTWVNGSQKQASILSVYCNADNLQDSASFVFQLFENVHNNGNLEQVTSGVLNITGDAYQNWQTNDYAYDWTAQQLNLTIIGEYVIPIAQ